MTRSSVGLRPTPHPRSGDDPYPGSGAGTPDPEATAAHEAVDVWDDWSWPQWPATPEPGRHARDDAAGPPTAGWLPLLDDVADGDEPFTPADRAGLTALTTRDDVRAGTGDDPDGPDVDGDDADDAPWAAPAAAPSRRRGGRRVVGALGALAALSVGFLGGVVADRLVASTATDPTVRLAGEVETDGDGVLAVRGTDGVRREVRTSTGTRVVTANPVAGELPAGTMVEVWTHRDLDGTLAATSVSVRPVQGGPATGIAAGG